MTKLNTTNDRAAVAASQWRRERPDIDPFPMEVLGRLTELTQILTRDHLNPLFARFGLQNGEFDVLATLRRSGTPYALTPTALYEAAMISSGGMTARIDRLEKAGLIERRKHPTDRRGTLVALTEKGKTAIDDILPEHIENELNILRHITQEETIELNKILKKMIEGIN
ncbi:MarR family winged helix-turn-helix transcriptional regulator [Magnetospirillum molischianum]|uniref:HTH-type transcriptional regulator pecS n=1 Tax=Magnetospirillum molischianum DSM 120 TaxID=1150626 RepID=H8FSQ4_MAGML|nr:MarR family transcriptional regulator [Magnetospirillum molischianum]CCG41392.1 HTH-type transcriptional regulator pecS [Magnetospirillum molischianum DSM 120]